MDKYSQIRAYLNNEHSIQLKQANIMDNHLLMLYITLLDYQKYIREQLKERSIVFIYTKDEYIWVFSLVFKDVINDIVIKSSIDDLPRIDYTTENISDTSLYSLSQNQIIQCGIYDKCTNYSPQYILKYTRYILSKIE